MYRTNTSTASGTILSSWQVGFLMNFTGSSKPPDLVSFSQNISLEFHYRDKFDSRLRWYEDYIVGCYLTFIGIFSLLGNGSSIVMFWRRYKTLTPAEYLLFNLAAIHLFLAVGSYPAAMVSSFSHRWIFGELGCTVYGFTCYLIGIATMISMLALAVVRYLKTCTHTYSRTLNTAQIKTALVGVYIYAIFWAVPPLFSIISQYEVEPFGTSCTLNWANPTASAKMYMMTATIFIVVVPYVIMIWCYVRITLLVRRNRMKKTIMGRTNSNIPSQMQLTIISAIVCIGFLVAWFPYAIVSIAYGLTGQHAPVYVALVPVMLAKSSCAYNPLIYIFVTKRYRSEISDILREKCSWLYSCLRIKKTHKDNTDAFSNTTENPSNVVIEIPPDGERLRISQNSFLRSSYQPDSPEQEIPSQMIHQSCSFINNASKVAGSGKGDYQSLIHSDESSDEKFFNGMVEKDLEISKIGVDQMKRSETIEIHTKKEDMNDVAEQGSFETGQVSEKLPSNELQEEVSSLTKHVFGIEVHADVENTTVTTTKTSITPSNLVQETRQFALQAQQNNSKADEGSCLQNLEYDIQRDQTSLEVNSLIDDSATAHLQDSLIGVSRLKKEALLTTRVSSPDFWLTNPFIEKKSLTPSSSLPLRNNPISDESEDLQVIKKDPVSIENDSGFELKENLEDASSERLNCNMDRIKDAGNHIENLSTNVFQADDIMLGQSNTEEISSVFTNEES